MFVIFGLSTSPYVFTKFLRPVVAHWRSQGIIISVYLDDGIGADSSKALCSLKSQLVQGDLGCLGLLMNEEKSNFNPRQKGEHLGFILDLSKGEFSILPGKIDHLFNLMSLLLDDVSPSARRVSRITGTLSSEALCSSSFREIRAIRFVLHSFSSFLAGKECKHRSDNQSVCSMLTVGSSKPHLQNEAVAIYNVCHEAGIRFSAEWIPRHLNVKADYLSKVVDTGDWMLNPVHFRQLDIL